MELWDIYDKNRNLTGRQMHRGSEFGNGDFHLVVHVCIFNSKMKCSFNNVNHGKVDGQICGI